MKLKNRVLTRRDGEERGRKPKDIKDCKVTVSISISPKLLEQAELECRRHNITKSGFIGGLIADYFEGRTKEKMPENLEKGEKDY
jgi:hypothetical protein